MNKNDQEYLVQRIRTQYTESTHTELDELRRLHAKVKRPANIFAYAFGGIGALVMGAGMSLVMTDLGTALGLAGSMLPGIAVGLAGMCMALINYPVYQKIVGHRKQRYADQVLKLSGKIMKG